MDRNEKNQFNINKNCYAHFQKKCVGYTKNKLGLDTTFELGISSGTFHTSEGRPKSHLAPRSPRLLLASAGVPARACAPHLPRACSPPPGWPLTRLLAPAC
jgi:hypothetical protein